MFELLLQANDNLSYEMVKTLGNVHKCGVGNFAVIGAICGFLSYKMTD